MNSLRIYVLAGALAVGTHPVLAQDADICAGSAEYLCTPGMNSPGGYADLGYSSYEECYEAEYTLCKSNEDSGGGGGFTGIEDGGGGCAETRIGC